MKKYIFVFICSGWFGVRGRKVSCFLGFLSLVSFFLYGYYVVLGSFWVVLLGAFVFFVFFVNSWSEFFKMYLSSFFFDLEISRGFCFSEKEVLSRSSYFGFFCLGLYFVWGRGLYLGGWCICLFVFFGE